MITVKPGTFFNYQVENNCRLEFFSDWKNGHIVLINLEKSIFEYSCYETLHLVAGETLDCANAGFDDMIFEIVID